MPLRYEIESAGCSDVGQARSQNEDQYVIVDLVRKLRVRGATFSAEMSHCQSARQGTLLIAADGMGGHQAGDVASSVAVRSIIDYLCGALPWFDARSASQGRQDTSGIRGDLTTAVKQSDREVRAAAERGDGRRGMGTTLTVAYLGGGFAYLAHVGDSRAYLHRNGELFLLTRDHTMAAEINAIRPGTVEPDARWHHVLTRAIGGGKNATSEPDVSRQELADGDVLLLCSDGLTNDVPEATIATVLQSDEPCEDLARGLIERANAAGGRDNITVVVARCRAA